MRITHTDSSFAPPADGTPFGLRIGQESLASELVGETSDFARVNTPLAMSVLGLVASHVVQHDLVRGLLAGATMR